MLKQVYRLILFFNNLSLKKIKLLARAIFDEAIYNEV